MTPDANVPSTSPKSQSPETKPSYVKSAMRNMVKKRGTSLFHFSLTTLGAIGTLVLLAVVFH